MDLLCLLCDINNCMSQRIYHAAEEAFIRFGAHNFDIGIVPIVGSEIGKIDYHFKKRHICPARCVIANAVYNIGIIYFERVFDIRRAAHLMINIGRVYFDIGQSRAVGFDNFALNGEALLFHNIV